MNENPVPRNSRTPLILVVVLAAVIAIPFLLQPKQPKDAGAALGDKSTSGKIVMLDFYTDWCGYCTKMDEEVYTNSDVQKAMQVFEFRKVNPEKSAEGKALAEKYGVDGFPTVVFVSAGGDEVHRVVGYQPAEEFVKSLTEAAAKANGR